MRLASAPFCTSLMARTSSSEKAAGWMASVSPMARSKNCPLASSRPRQRLALQSDWHGGPAA
eukprot:2035028-Alexandrium_andersonii.AAC.1